MSVNFRFGKDTKSGVQKSSAVEQGDPRQGNESDEKNDNGPDECLTSFLRDATIVRRGRS